MKTKKVKTVKAKARPRFTRGKIPGSVDDAASDLINAVLDEPGMDRLLIMGSPAAHEGQEFDESKADICLVVVRGDLAVEFADAIREDPRWRK